MADAGTGAANGRALAFVLVTVGLNMLGVGLAWPILPKLVQALAGGGISDAAYAYAWIGVLYAGAQFVFAPLLGALSDARGRRPVLIASQGALAVDYLLMTLVPDLVWLAILRLASGAFAATISTANAYIADISTPANRARNFGYVSAAFGIGFIVGPVLGGLLGEVSLRLPFLVAGLLTLANVAFGWFALPETLPTGRRASLSLSGINPFATLGRLGRYPALSPLIAVKTLQGLAQRGLEASWVLYTAYRFGWGVAAASLSLAFVGVCYFAATVLVVGPLVARLGERRTALLGLVCAGVSMLAYGFIDTGWQAYPAIALYCFGNAIAEPALLSLASATVGEREQGAVQGTMTSVNALTIIVGPLLATLLLAAVTAPNAAIDFPGAWFALSAILYAGAFAIVRTRLGIASDRDNNPT